MLWCGWVEGERWVAARGEVDAGVSDVLRCIGSLEIFQGLRVPQPGCAAGEKATKGLCNRRENSKIWSPDAIAHESPAPLLNRHSHSLFRSRTRCKVASSSKTHRQRPTPHGWWGPTPQPNQASPWPKNPDVPPARLADWPEFGRVPDCHLCAE